MQVRHAAREEERSRPGKVALGLQQAGEVLKARRLPFRSFLQTHHRAEAAARGLT